MKKMLMVFAVTLFASSCKTYTVSTEDFRRQLTGKTQEQLKKVEINNPLLYKKLRYHSNNIASIEAVDKKGDGL